MKKQLCILLLLAAGIFCAYAGGSPTVGIAWKGGKHSEALLKALDTVGIHYVFLDQVTADFLSYDAVNNDDAGKASYCQRQKLSAGMTNKQGMLKTAQAKKVKKQGWKASNVLQIVEGVDAVLFPGGEDVSPTLYGRADKQDNASKTINATRDVSDYLLMRYCIDNDIPTLGICRGMQVMGIASGSQMIQDMGLYYKAHGEEYADTHLKGKGRKYTARHDVAISAGSLACKVIGKTYWEKVFSAHHQAVFIDPKYTEAGLVVSGTAAVGGDDPADWKCTAEIVERTDKTFMLGIQSHPELATKGTPDVSAEDFEICIRVFTALKDQISK